MFSQKADAANLYGAYYNREIRVNGEIPYANGVKRMAAAKFKTKGKQQYRQKGSEERYSKLTCLDFR